MIRRLFVWICLLSVICPPLLAQWSEDFDEITQLTSPPWRGQIEDFTILKKQLRLYVENPEDVNESRIAVSVPYSQSMTWRGYVKLDFRPTANNYLYCYLYCYNEVSDTEFDYVALRWGSGSKGVDLVDVRLTILPSGASQIVRADLLIDGSAYPLGQKSKITFHTTYETGKGWNLWLRGEEETADQIVHIGQSAFDKESPFELGGLGIDCFYTKSRAKAFTFDNLSVMPGANPPTEEEEEEDPTLLGQPTLNELMANPLVDASEYIELYNPSDQPVVLSKFAIGLRMNGQYPSIIPLPTAVDTLRPGEYIVLTKTAAGVTDFYPQAQNVVTMENLPQLANKGFTIGLFAINDTQPLEEVVYTPQMLGTGNVTRRGVALERISFEQPASDSTNWAGGLQSAGYATPGYINSQSTNADTTQQEVPPAEEAEGNGPSYLDPKRIATEINALPQGSLCGSVLYLLSGHAVKYINGNATKRWCRHFLDGKPLRQALDLKSGTYMIVVWIQRPDRPIYPRKCIISL